MKHAYNKKKIDPSKYVNIETGQPLSDEMPELTSLNVKNKELIVIDYNSYVMINKDAIALLSAVLSEADMGRLLEMADMIETEFNILCTKDNKIQDRKSLSIDLNLAPDNVTRLINKFHNRGILGFLKTKIDNKVVNTIILNPFIARKRKTIGSQCVDAFQRFDFR